MNLFLIILFYAGVACSSRPVPPYRRGMEMTRVIPDLEEIPIGANVSFRCADGLLFESDLFNRTEYNATCLDNNVWHIPDDMANDTCVDAYYCPTVPFSVPTRGNVTVVSSGIGFIFRTFLYLYTKRHTPLKDSMILPPKNTQCMGLNLSGSHGRAFYKVTSTGF